MSSDNVRPVVFGLRLATWYATLFVAAAIAILYLTYYVTAASLAQRDHQILQSKLGEYATAYRRGGLAELTDTVRAEQLTAPERLFVRVINRGREVVVLSMPDGWNEDLLETASWQLVRVIRHLPRLTAEERARIEQLMPRSAEAIRQDIAEEEFLGGGEPPSAAHAGH